MSDPHGRINPVHTEEQFDTIETDSSPPMADDELDRPREKRTVDLTRPELDQHVIQSIDALAEHPDVYQRDGRLVQIVYLPRDEERCGVRQVAGTPVIQKIAPAYLLELLAASAVYYQQAGRGKSGESVYSPTYPPKDVRDAIHARGHWQGIRPLSGIVETPVLRRDGSLLDVPGYDVGTGLLYEPSGGALTVPEHPPRKWAIIAVRKFRRVFRQFPWVSAAHFSAFLAAMLTVLARRMIDGPTPFFLIDANTPGSGKSLLARCLGLILYGRDPGMTPNTTDDGEMQKRLTTIAMAAAPLVILDNISGQLGTPSLDSALTTGWWTSRILGGNQQYDGPLRAVWVGTGNNAQPAYDMPRRICYIRLESPLENPEERDDLEIEDLPGWIQEHRSELLWLALIILRAFVAAGRPSAGLRQWGSYTDWTLIRDCLVWGGLPDPASTRDELRDRIETDRDVLSTILDGWTELDPQGHGLTSGEIAHRLNVEREQVLPTPLRVVRDALCTLCRTPAGRPLESRKIGQRLAAHRGTVVTVGRTRKRLSVCGEDSSRAKRWTAELVHSVEGHI